MAQKWIKKGDRVVVIAGNDRGRVGEVLEREKGRVIVGGVNIRKKHRKRTREEESGGLVEREFPILLHKVALCDEDGAKIKKVRVSLEKGKRLFYLSKDGEERELRVLKKLAE